MAPSTRNTPRNPPIPSTDTEMEDVYQPLALPAPHAPEWAEQESTLAIHAPEWAEQESALANHAPEWADQEATLAIQPANHPEPTL
jgi:hypothetical protein